MTESEYVPAVALVLSRVTDMHSKAIMNAIDFLLFGITFPPIKM
jgi:hypothetical protein